MNQKVYKKINLFCLAIVVGLSSLSCVETFDFESEIEDFESALVVEATITNELKQQQILISRAFPLDTIFPSPEMNANVKVVDDAQNEYPFQEIESGTYISTLPFRAQSNREYTLEIATSDGRKYASKPERITQTTQIDNLYASRDFNENEEEGMSIYVDSHDPSGNSRFYRYTFEETFKIIAPKWKIEDLIPVSLNPPEVSFLFKIEEQQICYGTNQSNAIILANTSNFVEDRLEKQRVRFVNRNNYILSHRYSILVKQHVQSNAAHSFYQALKDISESESLLSQTQPGFLNGNLHSETNSEERVLGFFEVSSVDTKRIYFNYTDFFPDEILPPYAISCSGLIAPVLATPGYPPVSPLIQHLNSGFKYYDLNPDPELYGPGEFLLVQRMCGDCTALGSNIVPDFWIE